MLAVLRQRNFTAMWIGQLISLIGDWVLFAALPFYIYTLTGSTLATGIMFIVQTIPRLFLGSLAGVFIDRWNRKYTMLITDLIQAFVLLPLLLIRSAEWVWIVYIFAFVENTVSQFFIPAKSAIIPQIVDETHLMAANSLNSTSQELTRLVGPFIGGILFGLFGLYSVIILDVCSFLLSALMISTVTLSPRLVSTSEARQDTHSQVSLVKIWREWVAGMRLVKRERLVAAIFTIIGVAMIGEGIIEVVLVGYVSQVLHGTAIVFGWLMSAQAIGGIAGSLLITQLSKLISPRLLIPLCGLTFGSLLVVIAVVPVLAIILPLIAVIGMTAIGFFVSQITLLQSNVSNEYQGRIFGAFNTLQAISMLFGMILASGLGDKIGIVPMIIIDAACNILAALLAFVLIRPQLIKGSTTQTNEGTTSQPLSDAAPVSETMPA